jgi:hypothetical protein
MQGTSTKTCRCCQAEKPLSDFYFRSETGNYRTECKECVIERQRYQKLGVCNTKYDEMLTRQKGACAICNSTLNSSRYTKLAVDHDHRTGKVRGLLCTNCNTALGLMKDSVERFESAIQYLKRHRTEDIV